MWALLISLNFSAADGSSGFLSGWCFRANFLLKLKKYKKVLFAKNYNDILKDHYSFEHPIYMCISWNDKLYANNFTKQFIIKCCIWFIICRHNSIATHLTFSEEFLLLVTLLNQTFCSRYLCQVTLSGEVISSQSRIEEAFRISSIRISKISIKNARIFQKHLQYSAPHILEVKLKDFKTSNLYPF